MSIPEIIPGYVRIADVGNDYRTSRKTVERRRDKARDQGNAAVLRMFRLRAKDGEIFEKPALDLVQQLTREGRMPEWFVSRNWLERTFGPRSAPQDGPPTSRGDSDSIRQALDELKQQHQAAIGQYEARIGDLKEQLLAAEKRQEALLEHAERDKQRFADATSKLTQVLALPGIAEATKAQNAAPAQPETTAAERRIPQAREADSSLPPTPLSGRTRWWQRLRKQPA